MAADQKCRATGNVSGNALISGIPVPATFVGADILPNTTIIVRDGVAGPFIGYYTGTTTGGQTTLIDLHAAVYCANGIAVNTFGGNTIIRYT